MSIEDFRRFTLVGKTEKGTQEFIATPENTELYLHGENFRDVDHIFIRIDETERRLGAFVWRHVLGEEEFEEHTDLMCGSWNWVIHYRPEPTEQDMLQYARDVIEIPDSM